MREKRRTVPVPFPVESGSALALRFQNQAERDEYLIILDFILFHLERYERMHPESVGRTLFNEKYDITSLPFWLSAVKGSRISGLDAGAIQQVFNRAIKAPPEPEMALPMSGRRFSGNGRAHDIRYFQWIIRKRIEEIRGYSLYPSAPSQPEPPRYHVRMPTLDEVLKASNHYEALGMNETASPDRIKRRYRKQALLFHPDRHLDAPPSEMEKYSKAFQRITEAYDVLMDPVRRRKHDQEVERAGNGRKNRKPS